MADVILSLAVAAAACVVAVLVHRIRNDRFPAWAVWVTAALCAAGWLFMLLSDWPLERLDQFWSSHSVLASTISSLLLVGVVFLVYERAERHRQSQLEVGISGAGAGGMVDHLVDIEVALALLSAPVGPDRYAPAHWGGWSAPGKPLKWLREGRIDILGTRPATGHGVPLDPRTLPVGPSLAHQPWGLELIDQCTRRLLAAMRDWNSLIASSDKGTHALLALSQLRKDLMRLHETYRRAEEDEAARAVLALRAEFRVLAVHFEDWSGAPQRRPEILAGACALVPYSPGAPETFATVDRSLRQELTALATTLGLFSGPLRTVEDVRGFARVVHRGQTDKLGRDYVEHHLEPVAAKLADRGPHAEMAGLLHDALEDTWVSAADLRRLEVPEDVVAAVEAVSKRPGEAYDDLIDRAAADPLGVWVKLADNELNLESNAELARTDPATAARLRTKYDAARMTLISAAESHP